MRARSSRTPAGMPVTMTVSCGPCDSPAERNVKRDMAGKASRPGSAGAPPAILGKILPDCGRDARAPRELLPFSPMDKSSLRDLFPVTKNVLYFNHAAVGPLSTRAYEAMERFIRDQRDFGALHWKDW